MLQHLWAGPISNASVDVVRGGQSVEVHAVGVTKVMNTLFLLNIEILIFLGYIICSFSVTLGKCNGAYSRRNSAP